MTPVLSRLTLILFISVTLGDAVAEIQIDFEWWRDAKGYRLVPASVTAQSTVIAHPLGIRAGVGRHQRYRIVRLGGQLQSYKPFEAYGATLYKMFARIKKPTEMMDFVGKFGPLTKVGLKPRVGDDLDTALVHAEAMREAIDFAAGGPKGSAILVEAQSAPLASMNATLVLDPVTRRPKLKILPVSLLDTLWLSLAQDLSQQGNLRICAQCGEPFRTGPGTGRRLDAKFCSEQHKIAFHSLKRSTSHREHDKDAT